MIINAFVVVFIINFNVLILLATTDKTNNNKKKMEELFTEACAKIDEERTALHELSQAIWSNPELNFEEKTSHKILTDFLEKKGFNVERSYKLETAFRATWGHDAGMFLISFIFCHAGMLFVHVKTLYPFFLLLYLIWFTSYSFNHHHHHPPHNTPLSSHHHHPPLPVILLHV